MTAVINFTPLYGASENEPFCSVLQIDDYRILLDCGWDERFDEAMLEPLRKVIPDINCVLLTHADLAHLGALPYACGKLGLSVPVYCTKPVWDMGQMFMYDAYSARKKYDFDVFDLEDVDLAFVKNKHLKRLGYQVEEALSDRGEGIVITPYLAGHMIGGTVWKITKENEEIVYAVDFNHRKERHLEGSLLEVCSERPTVLITDAMMGLSTQEKRPLRQKKDNDFNQAWFETIRNGGNVLLPCDAAGRVLELILMTHQHWTLKRLGKVSYSLAFLSDVSATILDFARNLIAWMSETLKKQNDDENASPFTLKDLHRCYNMDDLNKLKQPYVVFATSATLEGSFAQDVFMRLAEDPKNMVLLTTQTPSWTLASRLLAAVRENRPRNQRVLLTFQRRENVLLQGEEKAVYLEEKKLKKEQQLLEQKIEEAEDDSDDDEEMGGDEPARRTKFLVPKFPMYPCVEVKKTHTVYGEVIVPDDYKIVEHEFAEEQAIVEEVEMEQDDEGPPKKTILKQTTVDVRCAVRFVDFEGRAAGDSMEKIIGQVAPKKLILVHGSQAAKTQLAERCRAQIKNCKEVVVPVNGQCVDVSSGQNIFRVNLNPSFVQSLNFVKVGEEYEIAYAEGEVKIDYKEAGVPILTKPSGHHKGHDDVFIGNPHLADLRDALVRNRIKAEVINQVVVCCNGLVNVRKLDAGNQISVQGALCPEYFEIRNVLYGLYKIV